MTETTSQKSVKLISISSLSPYEQNWTIKGRVSFKSVPRTLNLNSKELTIMTVDFVDETAEITANFYDESAEFWCDKIEEGKVYLVSRGVVKMTQKKYSSIPNEMAITLKKDAEVVETDDQGTIPYCRFYFADIDQVLVLSNFVYIDFVGIVTRLGDVRTVGARNTRKQEVFMMDDTGKEIELTLWGDDVNKGFKEEDLVAIKNVKVKEYRGTKSLSWDDNARYELLDKTDIYIPRAANIWEWYAAQNDIQPVSVTSIPVQVESSKKYEEDWCSLGDAVQKDLGRDKNEFFWMTGCLGYIEYKDKNNSKAKYYYQGCPSATCNKKVVEENDGTFFCPKCTKAYDSFIPQYLLKVVVKDHTDHIYANIFTEATNILGQNCKDLYDSIESGETNIDFFFSQIKYTKFHFKIKASPPYNSEHGRSNYIQYTISSVKQFNPSEAAPKLAYSLQKLIN